MPTTRRSARSSANTSPATPKSGAGTKRKAEGTPTKTPAKRGKKEQKTLDETMDIDKPDDKPKREGPDPHDTIVDSDEDEAKAEGKAKQAEKEEKKAENDDKEHASGQTNGSKTTDSEKANGHSSQDAKDSKPEEEEPTADEEKEMIKATEKAEDKSSGKDDEKADDTSDNTGAKNGEKTDNTSEKKAEESQSKPNLNGNTEKVNAAVGDAVAKAEPEKAVEKDSERAEAEPSNILEKGIIYVFTRGRVGLDDPSSVTDIQRTYFILRPLPSGGKLTDSAPIGDAGKNRIISLPKKVFPASRRDQFLCFVTAADSSFEAIQKEHLKSNDYETKTMGTRHTPAAKPIAEGIYAITRTGRESHLAYILTIPEELGQLQRDLGLSSRGAFVTSVRNPDANVPAGTAPPEKAEYPQGMKDDFRALRWAALQPAHLDFVNTQFLLIGEGEQDKLEKAVAADQGDGQKEGKEEPLEEMELLEKEDRERIKHLDGDQSDAIFKDLGLDKDEFSKIQTSWE